MYLKSNKLVFASNELGKKWKSAEGVATMEFTEIVR